MEYNLVIWIGGHLAFGLDSKGGGIVQPGQPHAKDIQTILRGALRHQEQLLDPNATESPVFQMDLRSNQVESGSVDSITNDPPFEVPLVDM